MKKGFTIIELLVASLLLGMLMTVLTMIFNQSSVAWRVGTSGVETLDKVRDNIAGLRDEADNAIVWNDKVIRSVSPWSPDGQLRARAIEVSGGAVAGLENFEKINFLKDKHTDSSKLDEFVSVSIGGGMNSRDFKNYTINVKSAGPDHEFDTWDDIWSFPDDFE